eukprot:jgi/Bigna1/78167/fgenesh1_pg.52_\
MWCGRMNPKMNYLPGFRLDSDEKEEEEEEDEDELIIDKIAISARRVEEGGGSATGDRERKTVINRTAASMEDIGGLRESIQAGNLLLEDLAKRLLILSMLKDCKEEGLLNLELKFAHEARHVLEVYPERENGVTSPKGARKLNEYHVKRIKTSHYVYF